MRSHSLSQLLDAHFLGYFLHLSGASVSLRDIRSLCACWSLRPARRAAIAADLLLRLALLYNVLHVDY